ncbi:rhamnulokinase [Salinisphaera sp.]|uniref:rhamnulokinase n=1 Tax=Salinisphaera sp. TaxID=1914330 RepID=UPI002D787F38|nr:FGGY-family carbohydrate kinase [Salinisphaera sp.]HET7313092.1 FGGY-family carbohydrate kinase [Salinisphaera sp.]
MSREPVHCLAFDFGAGSGRAMLGRLTTAGLTLEEVHRFDTATVVDDDGQTCWDLDALYGGLEAGLRAAQALGPVQAIGIDSWGVDFGLFDADGDVLAPPLHYRNGHGSRGLARGVLSLDEMHRRTGAQRLELNTVFQLIDLAARRPERLAAADSLLLMADLFSAWLTGERHSEYTLATTTGLFDTVRGDWHYDLIDELGLPRQLFRTVVAPGDICGVLRSALRAADGYATPVVAVGAHDTASAVAGLDLAADDAFLILGSWSLLGVETATPTRDARTLAHGFGNEGGVCGTHRLITNINGLYLIQVLREAWGRRHGEGPAFSAITAEARAARSAGLPVSMRIDPTDRRFFAPDDMMAAIDDFCDGRGQARPATLGEYALAIYRGLADQIAAGVGTLEHVFGHRVGAIHVSGGGSQDPLLCECIVEASGKPLRHGHVEASAYGNVLMQLIALGAADDLAAARALLRGPRLRRRA